MQNSIFEDHSRLWQELQKVTDLPLPGQEAQFKAVPPNRPRPVLSEVKDSSETRRAAVMALLHPIHNIPHLALIKRKEYPGVHSGQISFPGGKTEREDIDLLHTAYRETSEEVGVSFSSYKIWHPLTEVYIPPSRFLVQPYVGVAQSELNFEKEEREVEEILHAPISIFLSESALTHQKLDVGGFQLEVPVYNFEQHVIWGATAMMISELTSLIQTALKD